ncbi:MAG: biotin/lipoyl-binding protein, partial [Clostridia bacterium]|nr:biotin/lipoyl-binding protein [Clostridia bacterium]
AAVPAPAAPKAAPAAVGANAIKAPMQGNIMKVNVQPGTAVKKGDVLLVLEAMKMENDIKAPEDGTVASVNVKSGDTVATDDVLLTMN